MQSTLALMPVLVLASIAALGAAPALAQTVMPAAGAGATKVSGPFTHENLSIYLIHGQSADGPAPLTLGEALAAKAFVVHETGNVRTLAIENLGNEPVFLQAGDIVKGGQQDRVLTTSMVVPPRSGRMPIGAFCVEQGRWSARGMESVHRFESSAAYMPSKRGRLAMLVQPSVPAQTEAAASSNPNGLVEPVLRQRIMRARPDQQTEMWASVAEMQASLSASLGGKVDAKQSATSLQLSLENEKLQAAKAAFVAALAPAERSAPDVIGLAFAINGRINSADVYPSHAMLEKMWAKLIDAAATEAISARPKDPAAPATPPSVDDVAAFLVKAASGTVEEKTVAPDTLRVLRRNDVAVSAETRSRDGRTIHSSFVAF